MNIFLSTSGFLGLKLYYTSAKVEVVLLVPYPSHHLEVASRPLSSALDPAGSRPYQTSVRHCREKELVFSKTVVTLL